MSTPLSSLPTLAGSHPPELARLLERTVFLDLETDRTGRIHEIGAVLGGELFLRKVSGGARAFDALEDFATQAELVAGHNILAHDLPQLEAQAPRLGLLRRPAIDTLYLSPLAFPKNPYHRLIKDRQLLRDAPNDPVADARQSRRVLEDEWTALRELHADAPGVVALYRRCLRDGVGPGNRARTRAAQGLARFFDALGVPEHDGHSLAVVLAKACGDSTCRAVLFKLARGLEAGARPSARPELAYAVAWLRVAGSNSVLPPWVRRELPEVNALLRQLRDRPCDASSCTYCRTVHDPRGQVRRFFGFDGFRPRPTAPDGGSLQEAIVRAGMADEPLLAILPTSGGKSLCFQLPALARNQRRGVLTVVISPLQALMKDQVEGLNRRTESTLAAALYGMLTSPERAQVLEDVRLGSVAILYVSPEQLRNSSFRKTVQQRELGCWVFDEAHCLSKWGHDFRTDYLYAGRFIRELAEEQKVPPPPVACFTATAKREVREEILQYFRTELGQELALFEATVERENLTFEVQTLGRFRNMDEAKARLALLGLPEWGAALPPRAARPHPPEGARGLPPGDDGAASPGGQAAALLRRGLQAPPAPLCRARLPGARHGRVRAPG